VLQQGRLSNARFPAHHEHPAAPLARLGQELADRFAFYLSAQQAAVISLGASVLCRYRLLGQRHRKTPRTDEGVSSFESSSSSDTGWLPS
jgi:hypothetical protein